MQKPIIEAVEKQIALLIAAIYALGVIIVNFHLAEYGIIGQLSLLRPIYLFAGAYGALPIALSFIFFWVSSLTVKRGHQWVKALAVGVLVVFTWFLVKAALNWFDANIAQEYPLQWDWRMWVQLGLAALLGCAFYLFIHGQWKPSETTDLNRLSMLAVPTLFVWLVYGYAFSVCLYNRIPQSWGGTKSSAAEFIIDPDDKPLRAELEELDVKFYTGTSRTKNTKLVVQTDNGFMCAVKTVKNGETTVHSVLLKSESVKGVKYSTYRY